MQRILTGNATYGNSIQAYLNNGHKKLRKAD